MFGHIRKSSNREFKERAGYHGSNPAHKVIILQSQEVSWQVKQSKATLFYIFTVLTRILGALLQSLMEELFVYSPIHSAFTQKLCNDASADPISRRVLLPPSDITTSGDGPKRGSNQALKWQCEMGLCYLHEGKRGMEIALNKCRCVSTKEN